eukprot:935984_1
MDFVMTLPDGVGSSSDNDADESEKAVFNSKFDFSCASGDNTATLPISAKLEDFQKSSSFQTSVDEKIQRLIQSNKLRQMVTPEAGDDIPQSDLEDDDVSMDENDQEAADHEKVKSAIPSAPIKQTNMEFSQLNLSRPLLKAVNELGFVHPTPIQESCIPLALTGSDLLGNAVTGSGKTAAFMLPILERLLYRPKEYRRTRVLVLAPTRELAAQCHQMTELLAKHTDIQTCFISGGLAMKPQETALRNRPDIVIATPGRLIDHLRNSKSVHLEDLEILVLDEADRLLEESFTDELFEIIRMCPRGRQTMLFSATLTSNVEKLAKLALNNPKRVDVDECFDLANQLTQEFVRIRSQHESSRDAIILSLCKRSFHSHTIVFVASKTEAHRLKIIFGLAGLSAAELHGNLTQTQRLDALDAFKREQVNFLICTDLASRGLDIKGVQTIISSCLPRNLRNYVHRVGRTARAGKAGRSVTLVGEKSRKLLKTIMKQSKGSVKSRQVPQKHINQCTKKIEEMKDDIETILFEETTEKSLRVAEMQANKARNLMEFEGEIRSRPARTWFQSEAEKKSARERSKRASENGSDGEDSGGKLFARHKRKLASQSRREALKGLTGKKKKRKLVMLDEQKDLKRSGSSISDELRQRKIARKVKSASRQKKINDENVAKSGFMSKNQKSTTSNDSEPKRPKQRRRYAASIGDSASKKAIGGSESRKSVKKKSKKPKSKKKYKRRH